MERIVDFFFTYWKAGLEILLLAGVIYYFLLLFRGTRGAAVLTGFIIALLMVITVTQLFQLEVINWILGRVLALLAIAVLVIFQPELRRALAELGSQQLFGNPRQQGELIDVLVETAHTLSQKRYGGLMAVEREIGFRGVGETGVALEARASAELLTTIFFPNTPLHDGGVILRGDRVAAAGCVFPLTQRQGLSTNLGMRHRAAIGLTEETDAVVVAISEETGQISVAYRGHLFQDLEAEGLRAFLAARLAPAPRRGGWLTEWLRRGLQALSLPGATGGSAPAEGFSAAPPSAAPPPRADGPAAEPPAAGETRS